MGVNETEIISQELLQLLVCPVDHHDLEPEASNLKCTVCGRVFRSTTASSNMLVTDE